MKVKKIENKLALNKKTIANLGTDAMHKIQGGAVTVTAYCYSCNDTCNTKHVEVCTDCCTDTCNTMIQVTCGC
jgi:hypothetical protein